MMSQEQNTIEQLLQRKEYLKKEIHKSGSRIANDWKMLFTPPAENSKVQHWVNQAERAFAVYDGFMMMYKLSKRFGTFAQLFKKKKK